MISFHTIFSIARYERKTLFRSWFFRIFSGLSLLVLFGMNFGLLIEGGGPLGWTVRAVPSAIPYFNLLILNIAQAIIAVFLSSDFLKRDKKLDTTEVIYMRPMSNAEYVIGKTLGNIQVFLLLNVIIVAMALVFNALANGTSICWEAYGLYLLLINIPTLVFIMGLSFLVMSIIRNQAITFVLVLGYIGITLFFLQDKFYYVFDYMAFNVPMLYSDITGFGNLHRLLLHRGLYFLLGSGFIFLTIFLLKRLPTSVAMSRLSFVFALLLMGSGTYLAYRHVSAFVQAEDKRSKIIELNNQYVEAPFTTVRNYRLQLQHSGNSIAVQCQLTAANETHQPIEQLIFSLNNGLRIKQLMINGQTTNFQRNLHLLLITPDQAIQPGDSLLVEINYEGKIDETSCYLDIDQEERLKKYGNFVLNIDKRYAFVQPDYVLLTDEANWYPKPGVTYSTKSVRWYRPQFSRFRLSVETRDDLQAVAQGKRTPSAPGKFTFEPENPLTQMSLAIGHYELLCTTRDSLELGVWYLQGHNYFEELFPESKDTLASIIVNTFNDFQRGYNLEYNSPRLFLVEVPAQLKTYSRLHTSVQEYIQPEEILIPEKGFLIREADFEKQKKRVGARRGPGGRESSADLTPLNKELRVMEEFLRHFTRATDTDRDFQRGGTINIKSSENPHFIFPLLYNFQYNIESTRWPVTNRIFEAYLKGKQVDMRSLFMSNMAGESPDVQANILLQDYTLSEILASSEHKELIPNVIKLKGEALFSLIEWKAGKEEFEDFLQNLLYEKRYTNIPFEEFDRRIAEKFNIRLTPTMDQWFRSKQLPGYLTAPITAVKVRSGNSMKTMISTKITNFSDAEGIVKLTFRMGGFGGPGGRRGGMRNDETIDNLIHLDPHQTKEVSYLLNGTPRMVFINTLTSQNIPQTIIEFFRDVEEDPKAMPNEGERILDTPVQMRLPGEIIVDNEDPGFSFTKQEHISLLERLIVKEEQSTQKYQSLNWWRPPSNWTAITNDEFFGAYIHSAYYIKGGEGNQKASWKIPVTKAGYYEVYYHLYKTRSFNRNRREEKGSYHFTITGADGSEEATLEVQNAENGWNHLGTFYLSPEKATVELSNKSELRFVFADAVKAVAL